MHLRRRRLLANLVHVLLALALNPSARSAEPVGRFVFRVFGTDEGMPQAPDCLLEDRRGYLWAGTSDGLYRFDGIRLTRYGQENGLPSERVLALHETADGRLYAGTQTGLARFDGLSFVPLGKKVGLPDGPIAAIASDATTVYVGTTRGLFLTISELFHLEARSDRLPERPVTALATDPAGRLLIAREGRLYRREKGSATEPGAENGLPQLDRIDAIGVEKDGRIWVRSPGSLWVLPPGERFRRDDAGLAGAAGRGHLAAAADGSPIVPTSEGLALRRRGAWSLLTQRQGLPGNLVLSALTTRSGELWLGIAGSGLVERPGTGAFTVVTREDGLSSDEVWSVVKEKARGSLWIGTRDGVSRLDPDAPRVTREGETPGGIVFALALAGDGSVFTGSWPGGVTRYGPAPGQVRRYAADGLAPSAFQVISLLVTRGGDVWAGTSSGAYRLAGDRFAKVAMPAGGEGLDAVYALAEDSRGAVYAAGRLGLMRLSGGEPRRFRKRNGLRSDFVSSILPEPDGSLLVAYHEASGIDRVTVEGEHILNAPFDSTKRRVAFLGRDARGALWIGGAGVDVTPKGEGSPRHLGREDGLASEEPTPNSFFASADGSVFFGSTRGLIRMDPAVTMSPPAAPAAAFAACSAGKRLLSPDRNAELDPGERDLSVSFSAPGAGDARRLRFRYRVVGLDREETETALPELQLKGLPPGSYRIELRAVSPRGAVSAKPAVFAFTVQPTWWRTWWAWLLFVVLLAAALEGLLRYRTKRVVLERDRLKDELYARDAALRAKAEELEQASLSDPLTGIRNRRFFLAVIGGEVDRSLRAYAPLATPAERRGGDLVFYLIDVGDLKDVNESHGNEAGDAILVEAVRRLKGVVRASDYLVRWAGTVFLVVTRTTGRDQGHILAERLLAGVGNEAFAVGRSGRVRRDCHIGWAAFPWNTAQPPAVPFDEVLRMADRALDAAKGIQGPALGVLMCGKDEAGTSLPGVSEPVRLVRTTSRS